MTLAWSFPCSRMWRDFDPRLRAALGIGVVRSPARTVVPVPARRRRRVLIGIVAALGVVGRVDDGRRTVGIDRRRVIPVRVVPIAVIAVPIPIPIRIPPPRSDPDD